MDDRERASVSSKVAQAKKLGVPVVTNDFLHSCVQKGTLVDFAEFEIGGTRDNFKSGKILSLY